MSLHTRSILNLSKFRRSLQSEAGNVAMAFALGLPTLMGGVGVAVDFGVIAAKKYELQAAADQAAIAAVKELSLVNANSSSISSAADSFARVLLDNPSIDLSVTVEIGSDRDQARVILKETWTPFFAHFLNAKVTPIVVEATAKLAGSANICMLALDSKASKSIHMDKRAQVIATGCGVYANSSHNEGIRLDQDSAIKSALVCSVGGVKAKTTAIEPAPLTDCPVIADPLAGRTPPPVGACVGTAVDIDKGTVTLSPGLYCQGLKISGTANVTFEPGNYIIEDGIFEISGSASVVSSNAAFYLKGEGTTLQFTEDTSLQLKGAKDGAMAGLLFFEERSTSKGRVHRINSINASELTGTIYLPNGHLRIDPTTPIAQDSAYTAIIARTIELNEGPTLVLNDDYGDSNVPVPDGIKMSSQVVLTE